VKALHLILLATCILSPAACTKPAKDTDPARPREGTTTSTTPTGEPAAPTGRLCSLVVEPCTKDGKPCAELAQCNVTLARVTPGGTPLDLNLEAPLTWSWKYDDAGRLLESPWELFTPKADGTSIRKGKQSGTEEVVKYDGAGRPVEFGTSTKISYTADGRVSTIAVLQDGKWYSTNYRWGEKGNFTVDHNFPDSEEVCEPGPDSVTLDPQGRVATERYIACQINYSPFDLKYEYDAGGFPTAIDVTCYAGEPNAVTWRVKLGYDCK